MKFEIKTQNDDLSKSFFSVFLSLITITFLITITNISIKFSNISRYYDIKYLCKLLVVEKSSSNFKKLSTLTNQTSKQKIWEFCREFVK